MYEQSRTRHSVQVVSQQTPKSFILQPLWLLGLIATAISGLAFVGALAISPIFVVICISSLSSIMYLLLNVWLVGYVSRHPVRDGLVSKVSRCASSGCCCTKVCQISRMI